jgi:hypothetical protein
MWTARRPSAGRATAGKALLRRVLGERAALRAVCWAAGEGMIRLELAGAHTRLHSTLCWRCPQGPTGCCASPPGVEWSDVGRIVSLGGADWLLEHLATGDLRPGPRGLNIRRAEPRDAAGAALPKRCIFHGPDGCTIPPERRASTCNYYICDDAFADGGEGRGDPDAALGRRAHDALVALYGHLDQALQGRVGARWPDGPPWDGGFLQWLGRQYDQLVLAERDAVERLMP